MIKANELRIGNYLTFCVINDEYIEHDLPVCSIHSDNTIRLKSGKDSIGCFSLKHKAIKPIKISVKWLRKLGFVTNDESGRVVWKHVNNKYDFISFEYANRYLIPTPYYFDNAFAEGYKIEYIHQLQNLFFSLTGQELQLTNSNTTL